jgi:YHS domain-containing protein
MVVDPVCGEALVPAESEHRSHYQGKTYHFCCLPCQLEFAEAPEKYLGIDA